MTRGQIAIIYNAYHETKTRVMTSIEFNGDMYLKGGHGVEVIRQLKKVNDVADYQYIVAKFNCDHHHYNDCDRLTYDTENEKALSMLDFTKDYFENWFSDYVYLKNITKGIITIKTEKRNDNGDVIGLVETELEPYDIVVLCFGEIKKIVKFVPKEN